MGEQQRWRLHPRLLVHERLTWDEVVLFLLFLSFFYEKKGLLIMLAVTVADISCRVRMQRSDGIRQLMMDAGASTKGKNEMGHFPFR